MGIYQSLLFKILRGSSDKNIPFTKMNQLMKRLGFSVRVKGSHHIYFNKGVDEIVNLQPDGKNCKSYQVRQVRNLIIKYKLTLGDEHDE